MQLDGNSTEGRNLVDLLTLQNPWTQLGIFLCTCCFGSGSPHLIIDSIHILLTG